MAKHAPRGPRLANPKQQTDLIHREPGKFGPRCTAKSKSTGKGCQSPAIAGGTVCRMHGGSAPQVQAAARERLLALQPLAIQTLHNLLNREEFPTVQLGAARDVLDRTEGKATETLQISATVNVINDRLLSARKRLSALKHGAD